MLGSMQAKQRLWEKFLQIFLFTMHFNGRFLNSVVPQLGPCLHLLSHQKHTLALLLASALLVNASKGCSEASPAQARAFIRNGPAEACVQDPKETTKT